MGVSRMTKDEMKNRISMALKDPILQQGFEIICKENAEQKELNNELLEEGRLLKEQIASLQGEKTELQENLKTAYRKGMRHMAKALKDYDRTDGVWTDYFEHTVDKVLQKEQVGFEEYGTLADQLTIAKNVIKKFYDFVNNDIEYDPENPEVHTKMWNELCKEAEQFLSSSE